MNRRPSGQRPVVLVGVVAAKQHDVAEPQLAMLLLEPLDVLRRDQRADPLGRLIEQVADIDDARLAAELPRLDLVGVGQPKRARLLALQFRPGDRMRRHVELRAGVAVDQQHVDVVRRSGADRPLMRDLKPRKRRCRPGAGILRRDQQRMVDESRRRFPRACDVQVAINAQQPSEREQHDWKASTPHDGAPGK